MGSQTLEILRQGVWASLTGGWFYDPHQDVFCNAVHLYLWLFLLCTPFVTYLYFPTTFTTWGLYCFTTAFTITVLKIINMALHVLYDKAQAMSDPNIKKSLKSLKENESFLFRREDECGIEMQVLGNDLPSRASVEQVPNNEASGANSMLSIDCQEPITSTIDLKVDVHRKNSSESSDSVAIYSNVLLQNVQVPLYKSEICQQQQQQQLQQHQQNPSSSNISSNIRSLRIKSKSEEKPSLTQNPSISEEILVQDEDDDDDDDDDEDDCRTFDNDFNSSSSKVEGTTAQKSKLSSSSAGSGSCVDGRKDDKKRTSKLKSHRLQRQNSLDTAEALAIEMSLARRKTYTACGSIDPEIGSTSGSVITVRNVGQKSGKLQRHRSSESNDERQAKRNHRGNLFLSGRHHQDQNHHHLHHSQYHHQLSGGDIHRSNHHHHHHHLQSSSLTSDLYLENSYTKSDLGIENLENEMSKTYLLQQSKPMRKDSSSTMSALQLPVAVGNSSGAVNMTTKKRRHSNAGCAASSSSNGKSSMNNNHNSHHQLTTTNVRRIKSAALEISCPQPSVSNLCPHPNSAEALPGQQIKNPQSAVLPPPSKCLVRNPHLNLCPKMGSFGGIGGSGSVESTSISAVATTSSSATNGENSAGGGVLEPVYPIAEQADEKSLNEAAFSFSGVEELDSEIEEDHKEKTIPVSNMDSGSGNDGNRLQRHSTTESESDPERNRTQSTDSETENNGSRSPLLNNQNKSKPIIVEDINRHKLSSNNENSNVGEDTQESKNGGDSGCPSSDCEQASASSKDMLLSKDVKNATSSNKFDTIWATDVNSGRMTSEIDYLNEENETGGDGAVGGSNIASGGNGNGDKKYTKEAKSLGAIPKTGMRRETMSAAEYFTPSTQQQLQHQHHQTTKRNLGAVPKSSTSRASSSTSSRSFSAESFCNEIFKTSKDQWITIDSTGTTIPCAQNVPNLMNSGNIDILYNGYARRTFLDSTNSYRLQPKIRRSAAIIRRNGGNINHGGGGDHATGRRSGHHHGHHRHQSLTSALGDGNERGSKYHHNQQISSSQAEEISSTLGFGSGGDLQHSSGINDERGPGIRSTTTRTLSIQGIMTEPYSFDNSLTSDQRTSTGGGGGSSGGGGGGANGTNAGPSGAILNIAHVEFNDSVYCDYFRHCSLSAEKPVQPKRYYKYTLNFFGPRELKISMDRLQLLALFDRDLNWFHVILAVILSSTVCLLGSTILQLGFYKDIFAFLFCVVIAGSQYSLLKSVQPDAASPIHGFNKTVAYSRPIYFCICSGLLVFSHHLAREIESSPSSSAAPSLTEEMNTGIMWNTEGNDNRIIYPKEIQLFGMIFSPETFLLGVTKMLSIILLLFPIFFCLGLFPQINTFCMYFLEQVDMHVFGGSAACSLSASILSVIRSFIAIGILYGPVFGGLSETQGTQHMLFSMFCALLIPIAYHLSRSASDFTHVWALLKSCLVTYSDDDEEDASKTSGGSKVTLTNNEKTHNQTKKETCSGDCNGDNVVNVDGNNEDDEDDDDDGGGSRRSNVKEDTTSNAIDDIEEQSSTADSDSPDPLPKKLQTTVNQRLKNDLMVASVLTVITLALHCSTVFTVLQPDLNTVLHLIAAILGFLLHYVIPQMRKHLPWLCFANPILKQREFGRFEVSEAAKIMWFEKIYVYLCFLERNVLYPLIFISALTADSMPIVRKFGIPFGAMIVVICGLKCIRGAYADTANQYLILIFSVLFFKMDFNFASETFLIDYFIVSIIYKKACDFLLKVQFIVTYIAPWQITWGSAFHAFAQPFSVPHSAMLFMQAAISAILSTPLNPFLGSAIFLTSYVRPIKFWERDYNTRRIDHSNTRLSSQLERDLGADDNNLNSIFYEHLTRSLQHSLCGDLILGRWGNVNQGDCFVLASDYLNCLVHIIELGNGLCTFQMRGLEFRGTYCQQREVEAISEEVEHNEGCCCCTPGHIPKMLSANAMFSTRWLAWQVVAAQYVLEGYSISENLATATLQVFEFRKVLITYYVKSIIYYVTKNKKLDEWLSSGPIQDALQSTLSKQFVDLDPIFNFNLDEDFDFRAVGITRQSFCSIYLSWIQFCYAKRKESVKKPSKNKKDDKFSSSSPNSRGGNDGTNVDDGNVGQQQTPAAASAPPAPTSESENPLSNTNENESAAAAAASVAQSKERNLKETITSPKPEHHHNIDNPLSSPQNEPVSASSSSSATATTISKDSPLVSLCLALGLLARRSLATASHSSLSGVEFFLNGLHALFKGDFRITSPRDEWVFADMELLHGVVAPAVKMALKLHQDHFSSPEEYLDPAVLYEAITSHSQDLVISHEADPVWRSAVLKGAPNLLALRHVMEDGSDEYRIIRLTKRFLCFRVIKLNRECVRGLWAGQQQELIYLRNRNPERGSIQNAKQALRNIINSSCDQPIGYPIYVSPLTTSYAETNEHLCRIIGGSITLDSIRGLALSAWTRLRQRCREGCSSGSGAIDCDMMTINDVPGVYFSPTATNTGQSNIVGTISYGSQSLSGAGTRGGSLASMNKPTSSTLLAGFLSRERDQERESVRDRPSKKSIHHHSSSRAERERERRATLPITSSAVGSVSVGVGSAGSGSSRDLILRDAMGSTNSGLRQLTVTNGSSGAGVGYHHTAKTSCSAGNLGESHHHHHSKSLEDGAAGATGGCGGSKVHSGGGGDEFYSIAAKKSKSNKKSGPQSLIELNKKVIIVDGTEIFDCLDLGRRIDVVWPNEKMRSNGGRSTWKEWSPQEGMVGYIVHYWQPNHVDPRYRSNFNRTLYLIEIGDHYVPVGENGVKEYNQIPEINVIKPSITIDMNLGSDKTTNNVIMYQSGGSGSSGGSCSDKDIMMMKMKSSTSASFLSSTISSSEASGSGGSASGGGSGGEMKKDYRQDSMKSMDDDCGRVSSGGNDGIGKTRSKKNSRSKFLSTSSSSSSSSFDSPHNSPIHVNKMSIEPDHRNDDDDDGDDGNLSCACDNEKFNKNNKNDGNEEKYDDESDDDNEMPKNRKDSVETNISELSNKTNEENDIEDIIVTDIINQCVNDGDKVDDRN